MHMQVHTRCMQAAESRPQHEAYIYQEDGTDSPGLQGTAGNRLPALAAGLPVQQLTGGTSLLRNLNRPSKPPRLMRCQYNPWCPAN